MGLVLHCGASEVSYDALRSLDTPAATATHVPIPHFHVVELVRYALGFYGHEVTDEHHGVTEDGARYFGLLSLRSRYGPYEDTVGLRNSHDKKFPVAIGFGARVFVCDNLSFHAEHIIKRKHTANARRELPGLIAELVEPLAAQRKAQAKTFRRYRKTQLAPQLVDHAIMELYRGGVINVTRIADVMKEWQEPSFEGFDTPSAWRLFNAVTFSLSGRIAENPRITRQLHDVIDGVCTYTDLAEAA